MNLNDIVKWIIANEIKSVGVATKGRRASRPPFELRLVVTFVQNNEKIYLLGVRCQKVRK